MPEKINRNKKGVNTERGIRNREWSSGYDARETISAYHHSLGTSLLPLSLHPPSPFLFASYLSLSKIQVLFIAYLSHSHYHFISFVRHPYHCFFFSEFNLPLLFFLAQDFHFLELIVIFLSFSTPLAPSHAVILTFPRTLQPQPRHLLTSHQSNPSPSNICSISALPYKDAH